MSIAFGAAKANGAFVLSLWLTATLVTMPLGASASPESRDAKELVIEEPAASTAELEPIRQELGRVREEREQLRREVAKATRAAEKATANDRVFQWAFGILGAGVLLQGVELIRLKRRK